MKKRFLIIVSLVIFFGLTVTLNQAFSQGRKIRLYMEDGQIDTRPVRVYVPNRLITDDMCPKLYLNGKIEEGKGIDPMQVAPNQEWLEKGKEAREGLQSGTLLLFNIRKELSLSPFKACTWILPLVHWYEPKTVKAGEVVEKREMIAVCEREILLGNALGGFLLTLIIIAGFLVLVYWLADKIEKNIKDFIYLSNKRASLSLSQMALWTIAVGFMVMWFGFMRLRVPHIPDTLIWLMGLSAATSATGHIQAHQIQKVIKKKNQLKKTEGEKQSTNPGRAKLGSMLTLNVEGEEVLSLAKVQLMFWTVITIILFITKSYLDGQLWDVPYQLVLLMGVSQAGFLGRNQMAVHAYEIENKKLGKEGTSEPEGEPGAGGTPEPEAVPGTEGAPGAKKQGEENGRGKND